MRPLVLASILLLASPVWANGPEALVEDVDMDGIFEVLHEDYEDHGRFTYHLHAPHDRFDLQFSGEPPSWLTGSRVHVKGRKQGQVLAVDEDGLMPVALTTPLISGAQSTLVLLVNFSDKVATFTLDTVRTRVFTTASAFERENSYGQAWLTGEAVGPFTIALSSTVCDYSTLASQAKSAATTAGVPLSTYTRYVYVFPKNFCGWWGLATVGGNPSQAWINDNPQLRVFAHELGHNFGLYHSHSLDCGLTVLTAPCTTSEYGDTTDVMGTSYGHFTTFQKERLGWLGSSVTPPILTVTIPGQYWLEAYETPWTGPKALKVLKAINTTTGKKTWYYVEFRQPIGFDSWIAGNANLTNGVVLHTGSESSANSSYLLDLTPGTTSWADPALTVGQTFQDSTAGVTIDLVSIDSITRTALVAVTVPPPGSSPPPPSDQPPGGSCQPVKSKRCRCLNLDRALEKGPCQGP